MGASKPQDIRNLVLAGHSGTGKTTLAEAILAQAGAINQPGSVDDGSSVMDFDELEIDRKHTINPSLAFCDYAGKTINLIDTAGYPDFVGGAIAAMGGADVAMIVVSASAGIEVNTRRMFKQAGAVGLPKAFVINKIQGENLDLPALVASLTETFGPACKPMTLPTGGAQGVIDCFTNTEGDSDLGSVSDAQNELMESVIEADEELMEAYLGGEEVSPEQLSAAFSKAMVTGTVIPILFTDAKAGVGVKELLDAVAKYFPYPGQIDRMPVRDGEGEEAGIVPVEPDLSKPFIARAFKVTTDPFVGKLVWIRVLQGEATSDTAYHVGDQRKGHKIGHPFKIFGKDSREVGSAVTGDIFALAKVEDLHVGSVLHADSTPMFSSTVKTPEPMFSLAIEPKSRGDEGKISEALHKLEEEDPTFRFTRDSQTNESVISGIGDLHIRIMLDKMRAKFNLDVATKPPKIPYRETVTIKAEGHHRHKKQSGGAGQFGEVYLRVEPQQAGEGFSFEDDIFGGSIPGQFVPAVEKGVRDVLASGPLAGYPMCDVKVTVYDGKHHPVDSKEVAFRTAGKFAFIDAIHNAKPALLEPMVDLEITIPSEFMGDITGDLNSRRGRVMGLEAMPGGMQMIKAQAPLSEVMTYNSQLRSATGGQGSYSMEFSHYEAVPSNVQQQIVAAAEKAKEEAE